MLTVEGRKGEHRRDLVYHGISGRAFKRQFNLADHVNVTSAHFDNGLLEIELLRGIPEAMKPRKVAIEVGKPSNVQQLESKAA